MLAEASIPQPVRDKGRQCVQDFLRLLASPDDKCSGHLFDNQALPATAEEEDDQGCGEHILSVRVHQYSPQQRKAAINMRKPLLDYFL